MSSTWRPPQRVRALAIGVIRHGARLLVMEVIDDNGNTVGWRPLGGSIEFGELAADAVQREFLEELGLTISTPHLLVVLEDIYDHHGAMGHDIAFVFEAAFTDAAAYAREIFEYQDGGVANRARWIEMRSFRSNQEKLFPTGLIEHLVE
jgi:ADP-ribose pyrophosphatase YjhB (NUDIX family)